MSLLNTFNNEIKEIIELLDIVDIDIDENTINKFKREFSVYYINDITFKETNIIIDRIDEFHDSYSEFSVDEIIEFYKDIKSKHGNIRIEIDSSYGEEWFEFNYTANSNKVCKDVEKYLFKNYCFTLISTFLRREQKNNLQIVNMTENISIDKLKRILKDD